MCRDLHGRQLSHRSDIWAAFSDRGHRIGNFIRFRTLVVLVAGQIRGIKPVLGHPYSWSSCWPGVTATDASGRSKRVAKVGLNRRISRSRRMSKGSEFDIDIYLGGQRQDGNKESRMV